MGIVIERMEGELDRTIVDLLKGVFVGEGYSDAAVAEAAFSASALRERGAVWLARNEGRLAGAVLLVEPTSSYRQIANEGELEIHLLAVSPNHRRMGIGEALLRTIIGEAQRHRAKRLVLSTQPTMLAAHYLYEKLGFVRMPLRDWTRPNGRQFQAFALELDEPRTG